MATGRHESRHSGLRQTMIASLRSYWSQAESYQKLLFSVGLLLLASAVFHGVVVLATGGSLAGDVSWRKPILFGESFGLTCISIAWFLTFLPRKRWLGWLLAVSLGVANFYEVFWVSLQQWRGVPSHFNVSTPLDSALFQAAGYSIFVTGAVILVVTLWSLFGLHAAPSLAWSIRLGLLLLVAGQVFGGLMIAQNGHTFGAAGAMKVPHALALHGPQVLPMLGWLLSFARWNESRRRRIVLVAASGYFLLLTASAVQTFTGHAPSDVSPAVAVALSAGAVAVLGSYLRTVFACRSSLP